MSLLQIFARKQRVERLPRVMRAMEILIHEQETQPGVSRDRDLEYEDDHIKESVKYARAVAKKRKIDADIAAIACAMQNVGRIVGGKSEGHAEAGYMIARQMLIGLRCFEPAEIDQITTAVRRHSSKDKVDGPLDELVKDVDIYVRYVDGYTITQPHDLRRLNALRLEFHIEGLETH